MTDNATEVSMQLPEEQRLIRVYMVMKTTQLHISFINCTAGKKRHKEGKLFRSRKVTGMDSDWCASTRLESYIGRNSENGAFTTKIHLSAPDC